MKRSALLAFAALACTAQAHIITITITGTISSGDDLTGVFLSGCTQYNPCSLAGQPFTLVFTFDDSLGQQFFGTGISYIQATAASNPGTAVLTIHGNSFEFAAPGRPAPITSSVQSDAPPARDDAYSVSASDDGSSVAGTLNPAAGYSFGNSADWRTSFSYSGPFYRNDDLIANINEQGLNPVQRAGNIFLAPGRLQVNGIPASAPLQFVPVPPCRVVDTRNPAGPFGGPELEGGSSRSFNIPGAPCNIPSTAAAYSLNVTVVPDAQLGYLTIWPTGQPQAVVSTLNSDGRVKANAAIVPAGSGGAVSVFVTDPAQVILDIDGYFAPATASSLEFYPVAPCRIADTRQGSGFSGPFGPPYLNGAAEGRSFPVPSSTCNIPASAQAYSLNFTAAPHGPLGFLTVWPTGQPQPLVSTLNASTGAVTANAALVLAGEAGAISVFAANDTDLIIDVNGYFAPPGSGGLSLYTLRPCRVLDTRNQGRPFNGAIVANVLANLAANTSCTPLGTEAQSFVLNATVVPPGPLGFLTLWPDGAAQPVVSTLNALDGAVTSNMAIVPVINGSIDAFASNPAQLVLDIAGYFAP